MRVGIIGRHQSLLETARRIHKERIHHISIVITCSANSKEYTAKPKDFKEFAEEIGVPFIETEDLNDDLILRMIRESASDLALSMNWVRKIGVKPIEAFHGKIINVHCGDLPKYRGNAVYVWAMLQREAELVLTTHYMEADELDSGDILRQNRFKLSDDMYISEIFKWLENEVPDLFIKTLHGLSNHSIIPRQQSKDESKALRCYPRNPSDGLIDWTQPAEDIVRLIRAASSPYSGAFTYLGLKKLIILKASVYKSTTQYLGISGQIADRFSTGEVLVCCGKDYVLLECILWENESFSLPPSKVITSIRYRLGIDIPLIMEKLNELANINED